jgi:hypothetical protein
MWLRELVTKVLINPIIRTRTRHFRRAYHPTRDIIVFSFYTYIVTRGTISIRECDTLDQMWIHIKEFNAPIRIHILLPDDGRMRNETCYRLINIQSGKYWLIIKSFVVTTANLSHTRLRHTMGCTLWRCYNLYKQDTRCKLIVAELMGFV